MGLPHLKQKRASPGSCVPQFMQKMVDAWALGVSPPAEGGWVGGATAGTVGAPGLDRASCGVAGPAVAATFAGAGPYPCC